MEYRHVGFIPRETKTYDVVKTISELEQLLRTGSNAEIFIHEDLNITSEHKTIAKNKGIHMVFLDLSDVRVDKNVSTKVLNKPLT